MLSKASNYLNNRDSLICYEVSEVCGSVAQVIKIDVDATASGEEAEVD